MSSTPAAPARRCPCCGADVAQLERVTFSGRAAVVYAVRLCGPDVTVRELLRR